MRTLILILFAAAIAGCVTDTPQIRYSEYNQEGDLAFEVVVYAPEYSSDPTTLSVSNGVAQVNMSGSQDASKVEDAKGRVRIKIWLYGLCALMVFAGIAGFFLPNRLVNNKKALLVCGIGVGCGALIHWVAAAAGIMGWVIPAAVVAAAVVYGWPWIVKRFSKQEAPDAVHS